MATQTEDQFAGRAWPVLGPVPSITTPITPMAMMERALASGAGPETLAHLMALHERWEANKARVAYEAAMALARSEIPLIPKRKTVGFESKAPGASSTSYKYESLDDVVGVCVPVLTAHDLRPSFRTEVGKDGAIIVTCRISHKDGHFEETSLPAAPDKTGNKNSIQAVGSTVTYLQRYTMKAILGLAAGKDDDGQGAGNGNGAETITQEQADKIAQRLEKVGANIKVYCEVMGVESIPAIPAKRYAEAVDKVEWKEAKVAKEKAEANGA